ncbi:MAG: DNA polymerase-4 [Bacteriovoracaceae bacterium]|jgi:DNA polymerase-4
MDCFYAQVEMRDNPLLRGKPVGVGGLMGGRGVLCTSNYEARKYGVRAAMATTTALKQCPGLILVAPNFEKYKEVSEMIFNIYYEFTKKIEKLSLDEAYLDVTDCPQFNNNAIEIAKEIKRRIYRKTKLTASAGVSFNKLLAKIGSDLHKPNGLAILRPDSIQENISHFSISKIWGVGKVTQKKLNTHGIYTFGDLQKYTKLDLVNFFGDFGANLYNYARGEDNRDVCNEGERKSVSVETTFHEDTKDEFKLLMEVSNTFDEVKRRIEKYKDRQIKSIFVKIKYHDFSSTTIESQVSFELCNFQRLFTKRFYEKIEEVRLIGVGVRLHSTKTDGQMELPLVYSM